MDLRKTNTEPAYTFTEKSHMSPASHKRMSSAPQFTAPPAYPRASHHGRSSTESYSRPHPSSPLSPNSNGKVPYGVQQKPAPRAQVPLSVAQEVNEGDSRDSKEYRVALASSVGSAENMTGVGAAGHSRRPEPDHTGAVHPPTVLYTASPGLTYDSPPKSPEARSRSTSPPADRGPRSHRRSPSDPPSIGSPSVSTPSSNDHSTHGRLSPTSQELSVTVPVQPSSSGGTITPRLLGSKVFRDSALSARSENTTKSYVVPITWTGGDRINEYDGGELDVPKSIAPTTPEIQQDDPLLPGAWALTPESEHEPVIHQPANGDARTHDTQSVKSRDRTPIHEVEARVSSPEVTQGQQGTRKSETALVGMLAYTTPPVPPPPPPPVPPPPRRASADSKAKEREGDGQGWVLVNVHGKSPAPTPDTSERLPFFTPDAHPPTPTRQVTASDPRAAKQSSMSPTAKAIAIIDAMDAKQRTKSPEGKSESTSGLRKFLSLSKRSKGATKSMDKMDASDTALIPAKSLDYENQERMRSKIQEREKVGKKGSKLRRGSESSRPG